MRFRPSIALALAAVASALAACGSSEKPASSVTAASVPDTGPVALAPQRSSPQSIAMPVNQDELTKAVERLRITKKKSESPFEQAGADLNSTGRAKALVLFTGRDWCSPQGCTLAVLEAGDVGFRPVSLTIGVKPPIAVGSGSNAGWRDLIVKTGASKIVRLQFTGGGYPTNAAAQPDASADVSQPEVLIGEPGSQTAAAPLASGESASR